jgi:hypothetical protein
MQPNEQYQQPVTHQYPPQYATDGGQGPIPAAPAPQYQPPVEPAPPVQPTQPVQMGEIRPPESSAISFVPDEATKEILNQTYPEMSNALINIAIKKFAASRDFRSYFIRKEFLATVGPAVDEEDEDFQTTEKPSKNVNAGLDFSGW